MPLCKSLLAVPADLEIEDPAWQEANPEVCYELARLDADWPGKEMADTHFVDGQKLMRGVIEVPGDDPLVLVEGLIQIYNQPWELLALQTFGQPGEEPVVFMPVQPKALTFLDPRYEQTEEGPVEKTPEPSWIPVVYGQGGWIGD